jgi:hypothetical protein
MAGWILFIHQEFIIGQCPMNTEHSSSKNRGPSGGPQKNKIAIFSETAKSSCLDFSTLWNRLLK